MNIFALDTDIKACAEAHCDKHVVKMIIEYAQLMSTAHRTIDGVQYIGEGRKGQRIKRWRMADPDKELLLYKASHINHPCGIWTRHSDSNYLYLYNLWLELCKEYTHRYGRIHLTQEKLETMLATPPANIDSGELTELPQAMPDDVKVPNNVILAYRKYYNIYKKDFAVWRNRPTPTWFGEHAA